MSEAEATDRPAVMEVGGTVGIAKMTATEWDDSRNRAVRSFERIADLYEAHFSDKLRRKPFDLGFVATMLEHLPENRAVLEVGAGPAQFSEIAAERLERVAMSDASLGQIRTGKRRLSYVPALVADLRSLPFADGSLGGIAAYYCLMYGSSTHLQDVFREWWRTLCDCGVVFIAVHAGTGIIHAREWMGHAVDIELIMRAPELTERQLTAAGFDIVEMVVRHPLAEEAQTPRLFILARKSSRTPKIGAIL